MGLEKNILLVKPSDSECEKSFRGPSRIIQQKKVIYERNSLAGFFKVKPLWKVIHLPPDFFFGNTESLGCREAPRENNIHSRCPDPRSGACFVLNCDEWG